MGETLKMTVKEVTAVVLNCFILDVLAVAETNIGHGSTMDMMKRCFVSVLQSKEYADVTDEDLEGLDSILIDFAEEHKAEG